MLVHSEQGLGDAIQFLRYVPLLAKHKARVLLAVRQEIMALAATVDGATQIVEPSYTLPGFDYSVALPSLPAMFRTTLATVPNTVPYIHADPAKVAAWREKLGETGQKTVAIAWQGNPGHRNDHRRSLTTEQIAPLFRQSNVRFLVIQKDDEGAPDTPNVIRLGNTDLNDVAALMTVADLTISVDTVFCHLAGALGRPAWTLLSLSPDWRWGLEGETSPWYPTMRLFRQVKHGDWQPVLDRVIAALSQG
ncbi:MAG: glycosyltransferase family 9 protein [Rhizomicrobium sp.]